MKFIRSAFLICSMLLSLNAFARHAVPVIDFINIPVSTTSGKALNAEQVKSAIQVAASLRSWSIATPHDGKLQGTLNVHGKHTVIVEITYTTAQYSIAYKDSSNMKFSMANGQKVIHPGYNKWVQELNEAIRLELLKA